MRALAWILFTLMILLVTGCSTPQPVDEASQPIDISQDPIQVDYQAKAPIVIETDKSEFSLTPLARYRIAARVVGKKRYRTGWESQISPMDLALAWGKLAGAEYDAYISYSQNNRWYFYQYRAGSPFDKKFVITHSSNHHLIPATENLHQALDEIKEDDEIYLEGYLVNVSGTYRGRRVWWKTSLSRSDSGDGSCELFYVKRAQIDGQIFE